jgi:beta-lactamase regulating signal transducer with metallopeptidase domain
MMWWLAQNAVLTVLLAGIVAIVCRAVRPRPAVRHALWLVVLVKFLTPPLIHWPGVSLELPRQEEAHPVEPIAESLLTYQLLAPVSEDAIVTFPVPDPAPVRMPEPAAFANDAASPAPEKRLSWPDWLTPAILSILATGAGLIALLQFLRLASLIRLLARGKSASPTLQAEVSRIARQFGICPPEVRLIAGISSPLVVGLFRPRLLWPAGLSEELTPECLRAVLVHELAHLRRRDHWVAWLRTLAGCLWWWNPAYWFVNRQLGREAELACDAWVVAVLPEARRSYAEALLAVAGRLSRAAAFAPAVGMSGSRRDFERRLIMVMRDSVPCKAPVLGLVAIGVLTLATLPGLSLGQKPDKPAKIEAPDKPAQANTTPPAGTPIAVDVAVPAEVVFFTQADAAPGNDRERKIKQLEDRIQALLKEVKALRESKPATGQPSAAAKPKIAGNAHTETKTLLKSGDMVITLDNAPTHFVFGETVTAHNPTITLSRTTYKLPKEKADALAAFLKHIKASVLEAKVENDGLVVTTTPDVQQTIGQLVGLMTGARHAAAARYSTGSPQLIWSTTPAARPNPDAAPKQP